MKKVIIVLIAIISQAVPAFSQPRAPLITPKDAKTRLTADKSIVLLDVRTLQEFVEGYIEGAVLLPYDQIDEKSAAAVIGTRQTTVFVYCRSGNRSAIAATALLKLGYTKVFDLGGIISWPYGTVKGIPKK